VLTRCGAARLRPGVVRGDNRVRMAVRPEYTRARRATMQATMWVLFGATLALAAVVTHRHRRGLVVPLGAAHEQGGYRFQLPKDWQVTAGGGVADAEDRRVLARAVEPGPATSARTVTVLRQPLGRMVSPAEYLHRNGVRPFRSPNRMPPPDEAEDRNPEDEPAGEDAGPTVVSVAGRPGVLVHGIVPRSGRRVVLACAVLPTCEAVTVKLEGPPWPDPAADTVVREMAAAIVPLVPPAPPLAAPRILPLGGAMGVSTGTPDGFTLIDDRDPHRYSKLLLADEAQAPWTAIELVPCMLNGDERPQDLASMAELHDPAFHGAEPRRTAPGRWVIDPPPAARAIFAARAYLAADGDRGPAVLAIFRGGIEPPDRFDALWQAVEAGLNFEPTYDLPRLNDAGTATARELRATGLPTLLGGGRAERWWLWFRDPDAYVGWALGKAQVTTASAAGTRDAKWQTEAAGERAVVTMDERWASDGAMGGYRRTLELHEAPPDAPADAPPRTTRHAADARNGRLSVRTTYPTGLMSESAEPLPPNFVPGAWLPWLVGRLPDGPLVLRTDSAPGYEHATPTGLLSVLVQLETDEALVKVAEDGTGPMRCLTVTVNGSGEAQRWHFTRDTQPQSVELSRGRHRTPSAQEDVEFGFSNDPRMSP